jgi:hypothetical protein
MVRRSRSSLRDCTHLGSLDVEGASKAEGVGGVDSALMDTEDGRGVLAVVVGKGA